MMSGRKMKVMTLTAIVGLSLISLLLPSVASKTVDPMDLVKGAVLHCLEAATLGLPFEVWKTQMGRFRSESTFQSLKTIYKKGGIKAFYKGLSPKLIESGTKGAVLLFSKDAMLRSLKAAGCEPTLAGLLAGAGGGVCQTSVIGPCTYLVTAVVTGDGSKSMSKIIADTYKAGGISAFYSGSSAVAFRQGTNWASRQGFSDGISKAIKIYFHGNPDAKLTSAQFVAAGIIAGVLSVWNQPFEVARIEMQASANDGAKSRSMFQVWKDIVNEIGLGGLYRGIIPRIFISVWQTLWMVVFAGFLDDWLASRK